MGVACSVVQTLSANFSVDLLDYVRIVVFLSSTINANVHRTETVFVASVANLRPN